MQLAIDWIKKNQQSTRTAIQNIYILPRNCSRDSVRLRELALFISFALTLEQTLHWEKKWKLRLKWKTIYFMISLYLYLNWKLILHRTKCNTENWQKYYQEILLIFPFQCMILKLVLSDKMYDLPNNVSIIINNNIFKITLFN